MLGHFDRMSAPVWQCQRWSVDEYFDKNRLYTLDRRWKEDPDLPTYTHRGDSYAWGTTRLERGHLAMHVQNRAWGWDGSVWGCLMSNSVPQHGSINSHGAWWDLENAVVKVVFNEPAYITTVWTISGAIFRNETNPSTESPEDDFVDVIRVNGHGIPDATYKIVGWFDADARFQARGYVFEQPHTKTGDHSPGVPLLDFSIPDQDRALTEFIVAIDDIEERTGLDFSHCSSPTSRT